MNSKQTFRGFVTYYSNKYERFSTTTKILWLYKPLSIVFFAWASRMKIDIRKGCFWCKGCPRIVACDGTKIGIGFRNTFFAPIECAEKIAPPNSSHLRRLDRCFLKFMQMLLRFYEILLMLLSQESLQNIACNCARFKIIPTGRMC